MQKTEVLADEEALLLLLLLLQMQFPEISLPVRFRAAENYTQTPLSKHEELKLQPF
jgi:hypothetical protein